MDINLLPGITLTINPTPIGRASNVDAEALGRILLRVRDQLDPKTKNTPVYKDKEWSTALPGVTIKTASSWLISRFAYALLRTCQCCDSIEPISTPVTWVSARALLASDADTNEAAAPISIDRDMAFNHGAFELCGRRLSFTSADGGESNYPGEGWFLCTNTHNPVSGSLPPAICRQCADKITERARLIWTDYNEQRIAQHKADQFAKQQQRAKEQHQQQEYDAANPRYVTVTGTPDRADLFSARVNEWLNRGYFIWGAPLIDNTGRIMQSVVREDSIAARERVKRGRVDVSLKTSMSGTSWGGDW